MREFRDIPRCQHCYRVSDTGDVRSLDCVVPRINSREYFVKGR